MAALKRTATIQITSEALPRRIDAVDGLRAIAMTAVVAEHSKLLSCGWMGVWVFYVISGFVVTGSIKSRSHGGTSAAGSLAAFYIRRAARIWPAYFAWITLALIVSWALQSPPSRSALASLVFFYNNFALAAGKGSFPSFDIANLWTVSVEMQFYALYGFLLILAPTRWTIAILVAVVLLCAPARLVYGDYLLERSIPPLDAAFKVYSSSYLHFDAFGAGCLLALSGRHLTPRTGAWLVVAAIGSLLLYTGLYTFLNYQAGLRGSSAIRNVVSGILIGKHKEAFVYIPPVLTCAAAIALAVTAPRLTRWLTHPWLLWVGRISYGAYIVHVLVLYWIGRAAWALWRPVGPMVHGVHLLVFLATMVVTLVIAQLSFTHLESPIAAAATRFLQRRSARRGADEQVTA